jgi:hypothetical protein
MAILGLHLGHGPRPGRIDDVLGLVQQLGDALALGLVLPVRIDWAAAA